MLQTFNKNDSYHFIHRQVIAHFVAFELLSKIHLSFNNNVENSRIFVSMH